jgi:hypothetical protein
MMGTPQLRSVMPASPRTLSVARARSARVLADADVAARGSSVDRHASDRDIFYGSRTLQGALGHKAWQSDAENDGATLEDKYWSRHSNHGHAAERLSGALDRSRTPVVSPAAASVKEDDAWRRDNADCDVKGPHERLFSALKGGKSRVACTKTNWLEPFKSRLFLVPTGMCNAW